MSNNIRIRTKPNGKDNYVSVKVEQNFDFIEILSLKISQEKAYENFCSDYGALIGRITINNGFGVPNVRVSIFIPLDETDKQNQVIRGLYPYETVNDLNEDGTVYNILPKENETSDPCYTPVGSLPSKTKILDNDDVLYVYEKYYKYTAVTNGSGDYMIFGIPLGAQIVHIDADISDLGFLSQKPYTLIEQGVPAEIFASSTQFKKSKKLTTLPQIKSSNSGVNIRPFWGNTENCQIGINRFDYDLNIDFTPSAFFMGSLFGDQEKNSINKNCRPRAKLGVLCEQSTGQGTIEMIRKTPSGSIEKFDISPTDQITDNGAWAYQIPMNLDYIVTDEFGNIVPSKDTNVGIPTKAEVRFRISMLSGGGRIRARGKHLVPHNPSNPSEIDYNFDSETKPTSFATLYWDKVYAIKSFIPRVQSFNGKRTNNYLGIKNIDQCTSNNLFPFNRADTFASGFAKAILLIVCLFAYIIGGIVWAINKLFCALCKLCIKIFRWRICPFRFVCPWIIKLKCSAGGEDRYYAVGADGCDCGSGCGLTQWVDCLIAGLAEELGLYKLDFYNDWVNGTLYFHLFKAKRKKNSGSGKFCSENSTENVFCDTTYFGQTDVRWFGIDSGNAAYYKKNFYYAPMTKNGGVKLFATDLVNLGAIKDCDWQGVPRIIDQFESTTFSAPPIIEEKEEGEPTITGMCTLGENGPQGCYFKVNCFGIQLLNDGEGAINIRRQSELFVNLLENGKRYLSRNEICTDVLSPPEDEDRCIDSPAVVLRNIFYLLNFNGTKSVGDSNSPNKKTYKYDNNLDTPNLGTSFSYNGQDSKQFGPNSNGVAYNNFRKKRIGDADDRGNQSWGNSYYFYFGLVAGSTSLELFKKKYLQSCIQLTDGDFIISTTVTNSNTNSSSATDGCIEFETLGGSGPYNIIITNPTSSVLPLGSATPPIPDPTKWDGKKTKICNLAKGSYTIEVTDSTNATVIKVVEIQGPNPLNCSLTVSSPPSNPTCANGSLSISILGGKPQIIATLTGPNGNIPFTLDSNGSATIVGLREGTFTLNANDSDTPASTCQKTVTLKSSGKRLGISGNVNIQNIDCEEFDDDKGSIGFDVTGGTENTIVYRISCTAGPCSGYNSGWQELTSNSGSAENLKPGKYKIELEDNKDIAKGIQNGVYQQLTGTCPEQFVINDLLVVKYLKFIVDTININNKKQCDPTKWTIRFNLRLDPRWVDNVYYVHREPKQQTDPTGLDNGLIVKIDTFIPVVTPLPPLPSVALLAAAPQRTIPITFEIPALTYPNINNSVSITVKDVGDCESDEWNIAESNIRKPDTRLRFSDATAGGGSTGNLPYQRNLIDCSYPSGWSPGGVIQTVTFTPNPSVGSLPVGAYINLTPTQLTSASGTGAKFAVSIAIVGGLGKVQAVTIWNAGQGYLNTDTFRINGSQIGGTDSIHDLTLSITVDTRGLFTCRYEIAWLVEGGIQPYTITPVSTGQNNKLTVVTPQNQNADQWSIVYSTVASRTYAVNVVDANGCNQILLPNGSLQPSPRQIIVN